MSSVFWSAITISVCRVSQALCAAATPASAELIVNGSVEEGDFGGFPSFRRLVPGDTALTG
jgi:hypothetical protein